MWRWTKLMAVIVLWGAIAQAQTAREVVLDTFVNITIDVPPDNRYVKLVFPFILDSARLNPPLNIQLTDEATFLISDVGNIRGQNFILVRSKVIERASKKTANLVISVDDFSINMVLRVRNTAINTVLFRYSTPTRKVLLAKMSAALKDDFDRRLAFEKAKIDQRVGKRSALLLARLLDGEQHRDYINESIHQAVGDHAVTAHLFHVTSYSDVLYVLYFDLSTDIPAFSPEGVTVIADEQKIAGYIECSGSEPMQCLFVSENEKLASEHQLTMQFNTRQGGVTIGY